MSQIIIKPYSEIHKNQIIDLILKILVDEFKIPVSIEDQPDLLQIPNFYQSGNGNFWVALINDIVVGTIALVDIGNQQTALRKMFVAQEYRGNLVAKFLLDSLKQWSKTKNIQEIYLGTISIFLAAHKFYEKNGFLEISKLELPKNFPLMKLDTKFYRYSFK